MHERQHRDKMHINLSRLGLSDSSLSLVILKFKNTYFATGRKASAFCWTALADFYRGRSQSFVHSHRGGIGKITGYFKWQTTNSCILKGVFARGHGDADWTGCSQDSKQSGSGQLNILCTPSTIPPVFTEFNLIELVAGIEYGCGPDCSKLGWLK